MKESDVANLQLRADVVNERLGATRLVIHTGKTGDEYAAVVHFGIGLNRTFHDAAHAAMWLDGYAAFIDSQAQPVPTMPRSHPTPAKVAPDLQLVECDPCKGTGRQQFPVGTRRECGYCGGDGKLRA
jgi:hypothetical protein